MIYIEKACLLNPGGKYAMSEAGKWYGILEENFMRVYLIENFEISAVNDLDLYFMCNVVFFEFTTLLKV